MLEEKQKKETNSPDVVATPTSTLTEGDRDRTPGTATGATAATVANTCVSKAASRVLTSTGTGVDEKSGVEKKPKRVSNY